jgi:ferredoxin-NADP reductase
MAFQINFGKPEVPFDLETRVKTYTTALVRRRWLSKKTFEITLSRPPGFEFKPGQRISVGIDQHERDYSIVSAPGESELTLCIRNVSGGKLSNFLSTADIGASLSISGPFGYFTYKSSTCPAVFVATGTGIAPFSSMTRSGISGYILLHGVSSTADLYYASLFRQSADNYIPCLTGDKKLPAGSFQGTVTQYIAQQLETKTYDFYLCGRREMIRDVTLLIDERFPDSLVYTELFF